MGKPKTVNYQLIPETESEPYKLLEQARRKWHTELVDARIALAWRARLKRNKDGLLMLGKCVKVSDLQKELAEYDFIILLNREVWRSPEFGKEKKLALLDHELSHAAPALDPKTGEHKVDERGRAVWRIRRHDLEEFRAVVERHGCYLSDLEAFAKALLKKSGTPLLASLDAPAELQPGAPN